MQQKKIIAFIIFIFIASSAWLFRASDKFTDPNIGKNWWAVSFTDPNSKDLTFIIENHADQTDFHWAVLNQEQKIKEGNAEVEKGSSKDISVSDISATGKIVIEVTSGEKKKEIYKNL